MLMQYLRGVYLTMQASVKGGDPNSPQSGATAEWQGGTLSSSEVALVPVWVGMLRVQREVVNALDAALQAQHHLSLSAFEVLLHLSYLPERRMRLTALAESVVLTQSGISRLIDRLEQAGLVRREPFPGDARGAYAVLTEDGLARLRAAEATHIAVVRAQFLDHLSVAERTTLARVWERLLGGGPPGSSAVRDQEPGCEPASPQTRPSGHEPGASP